MYFVLIFDYMLYVCTYVCAICRYVLRTSHV